MIEKQDKRVTIICVAPVMEGDKVVQSVGVLMRTTKSLAVQLVANKTHRYTTKGKLKSFINKEAKLYKNSKAITGLKFNEKGAMNHTANHPFNGKIYASIWKKNVTEWMSKGNGEVNPLTGMPMGQEITLPRYELRVIDFNRN